MITQSGNAVATKRVRQRAGGNEVVQPLTRRQSSARLIAMEGSAFNSLLRRWASSRCQGCKTIGSSYAPKSSQRASTIRSFSATGRLWRSDRSMLIANSTEKTHGKGLLTPPKTERENVAYHILYQQDTRCQPTASVTNKGNGEPPVLFAFSRKRTRD